MDDANTNSTSLEANVDATDAIADLLVESEEAVVEPTERTEEATDDNEGVEELPEESTEEVEESDEEPEVEEDQTWAGVLGVDDAKVVLNEEGDFAGVNVKVDGETSTVDMSTLIMGYQTNKHNANTSKSLAEERKQFDTARGEVKQEYTKKLEDVGKLTEFLNNTLTKEFQGINWDQLRMENPAEYAASMQDFNVRQQEIQNIYAAISEERNALTNKDQEESKVQSDEYLGAQVTKMIENNPTWSDKEVLKEAFDGMSEFTMSTYGFTQDEFNNTVDARLIEMIKDAQKYRDGQKIATKKIKNKVPKFQKSSSSTTRKKVSQLDKLTKRAKTATGSDKRDAQSDAIAELLQGGL